MADAGHLEEGLEVRQPVVPVGCYLSERAWGTVGEDYSADGDAWSFFPHDHARSRAYRWNEDGMAGVCDQSPRLCLGLALWNGRDPILKERMFGLTDGEGNHGEDVKDYWWYLDALPSTPGSAGAITIRRREFPYEDLWRSIASAASSSPNTSCSTRGSSMSRDWIVEVHYAKADRPTS